jgi:uncharacterized FlgJ-related protein
MNQLINSIIRGFGFTLGSKAANSILTKKNSVSKKDIEILKLENVLVECNKQNIEIERSFISQKLTETEYLDLKNKLQNTELKAKERIQELSKTKPNIWLFIFFIFIVIPIIITLLF